MRSRIILITILVAAIAAIARASAGPGADLNGDGVVNLLDIVLFAKLWVGGSYDATIDLNSDGVINALDLFAFARAL